MSVHRVVAVIPARFGSTRLPGKPLLLLGGKPMVAHVVAAARRAPIVSAVLVATDHEDIAAAAREAGALAVMTDPTLPSGTDRVEAALRLSGIDASIIVNVQGDEPLLSPDAIDSVARLLIRRSSALMSTLSAPLSAADLLDPSKVKIVCRDASADGVNGDGASVGEAAVGGVRDGRAGGGAGWGGGGGGGGGGEGGGGGGGGGGVPRLALYFSRAPIGVDRALLARLLAPPTSHGSAETLAPSGMPASAFASRLHVGVYGFRRHALSRFVALPHSRLEALEALEQMRAVEAGFEIVVGEVDHVARGVDTHADLLEARETLLRRAGGEALGLGHK